MADSQQKGSIVLSFEGSFLLSRMGFEQTNPSSLNLLFVHEIVQDLMTNNEKLTSRQKVRSDRPMGRYGWR